MKKVGILGMWGSGLKLTYVFPTNSSKAGSTIPSLMAPTRPSNRTLNTLPCRPCLANASQVDFCQSASGTGAESSKRARH